MKNSEFIKSPLQYTGGKYKILKDIFPLFPDEIHTFIDLFGGGFNVGINADADNIIYNDTLSPIVELLQHMYNNTTKILLKEIDGYIKEYELTKENVDGYLKLRTHYNEATKKRPMELYTLICYGFNNQIRFNSKGEYNIPFGKREFNPILREKFCTFTRELHTKKIAFTNKNFSELKIEKLNATSFVYADPPYLGSVASYNEQGGWTEDNEKELLSLLNTLTEQGIPWALSNNLKYENPLLEDFIKKYKVHYLGSYHTNCSYQKKDKNADIEILVTNY